MGKPHGVRRLTAAVSSALLVMAGATGVAGAAEHAGKAKTRQADLVAKDVTASASGRSVLAKATIKNKPGKKKGRSAKGSSAGVVLSKDPVADSSDLALGALPIAKLPPKASQTSGSTIAVPDSVPAGSYYVVVCADATKRVDEKKEGNNCQPSPTTVSIPPLTSTPPPPPPPPPATVTVRYSANGSGTVTATPTGGSCTGPATGTTIGTCTVTSGAGSVVLTATATSPFVFDDWSAGASGPCNGTTSGTGGSKMTFAAPTANKSCVANFGLPL